MTNSPVQQAAERELIRRGSMRALPESASRLLDVFGSSRMVIATKIALALSPKA
jgi:hypothetical protein